MKPPGESADPDDDAPIDAAFFENILETDLANIVKKASGGMPLNKREREMIEEERTKRQKKPLPAFTLEGAGPATALERMTQKQLAGEWGVSERTAKGWIGDGRKKSDPCPLTRPGEMEAWFERMYAPRQCPEKYRLAAQRIIQVGSASLPERAPEAAKAPLERLEFAEEQMGMLAMLKRHREAEATLHSRYMKAVEEGNESRAEFLMSSWSKIAEKLRALEKVAPDALAALGIYVRRDEMQRELEPLHRAILKAFKQGLRMNRPRLKACETAVEWNLVTDAIVDEISLMLSQSDFREPLELDAA